MTGDLGLIGTSLKKRLIGVGHNIVGTVDLRAGTNILDINSADIQKENIDLMIHTAAHCKIKDAVDNPSICHENDTDGTFEVLEFCRRNNIPKILYFSSSRILSKEQNVYTAAKLYGENLCKGYKDSYGIDYIIVRPSTVYGPFWDLTKRLIHIYITKALKNEDLEIFGDPETKTLDFTYVEDFVDGIILALDNDWNKEYNISGDEEYKVYDLANDIIKKTGSKSKIIIKNADIAQPQKVKCDISEIQKIGYKPKVTLSKGVDECIEFYKKYILKNSLL
jgi:nucleoside-diphosphate-sugar epimerase